MSKFMLTAVGVAIVAVVATLVPPTSALAHARYKSSTPGTGEVLSASPVAVTISFTQNIQKVSGTYDIQVALDGGGSVTSGPAIVSPKDRTTMSVPLGPLTNGRYVVNWKNVSDDDGDPIAGAFSFYLNTQPSSADTLADAQLAAIGAPNTPTDAGTATAGTPGAATTSAVATAAGSTTVPATASVTRSLAAPTAATPVATATATSASGGSNNTTLIVVILIVIVVTIGGGSAALYLRGRRG